MVTRVPRPPSVGTDRSVAPRTSSYVKAHSLNNKSKLKLLPTYMSKKTRYTFCDESLPVASCNVAPPSGRLRKWACTFQRLTHMAP